MEFLNCKKLIIENPTARRALFCLFVMIFMTLEPTFLVAASAKTISEEQLPSLHAALVLKIAMFVQWPDDALFTTEGELQLSIAGDNVVFRAFQKFSDTKIKGQDLLLVQNINDDPIQLGHILFISSTFVLEEDTLENITNLHPGVLTISDAPHFNAHGGMIQISIENGRPRFTINVEAASDSGIKFSSKLLKIATIYEGGMS